MTPLACHVRNWFGPWLLSWGMAVCVACGPLAQAEPRTVRVGVYENQPKIFMGANGQPSGILGDLITEIAAQAQWTLEPVACEWQACLDALQAGTIDLMPDVAINEQRERILDFHRVPALLSWSQVYKRSGVVVNSALDLRDKRMAVLEGSVQQNYLRDMLKGFDVQAQFVQVQTFKEGFEMVAVGEADVVAANRFYGDQMAPRLRLESTPILFLPSRLFYATAQDRNADLLAGIDAALEPWGAEANSPYQRILKRWMEVPSQFSVPHYVWWSLAALGALLALSVAAGLWLRREVARQTSKLRASEDKLASILNGVDAFIYIKDAALRYQYANRKVAEVFGRAPEDVVGQDDAAFFDAETVAKLRANDLRVIELGERVDEEETNRSVDGLSVCTYHTIKLPLRQADGRIYALCGISTDVTRHKQAEEAIHQLAFFDPLTKLPNRRLLLRQMQAALATSERNKDHGALLFIDVDNFKDLNDTLGHAMGDLLLQQMAQRLEGCTRKQDTLARQGGDEFVVMLQGLGADESWAAEQARHVADKVVQALGEPYVLDTHVFESTVSVGVAMFAGQQKSQEELLKHADLAMYRAKAEGRNRVCFFDPRMQAQVNERTAMEAELREGLAHHQFVLHYQPQVREDGLQIGVEALVRWNHPTRGLVAPGLFIPVAESSGQILPLGHWILEAACRQAVAWAQDPVRAQWVIAVNMSAKQFRQPDCVEQVRSVLQATGARAHQIELELTESQLVDDVASVVQKMEALKALGLRLSLDDFGTGYSSLSMLKRLPLDQLKIDQSFVRDLGGDQQGRSIVRAIVTMGESLGLRVIAEGVETEEQLQVLQSAGCHYFQGYLLGRPAAPDAVQ